jgi:hypothetical protein
MYNVLPNLVVQIAQYRNQLANLIGLVASLSGLFGRLAVNTITRRNVAAARDSAQHPRYFDPVLRQFDRAPKYPPLELDPRLERMPEQEPDIARELANIAASTVVANYCNARKNDKLAMAQRDQHPKQHACVEARFIVRNDFPQCYAVGVFQPGSDYACRLRFSSAVSPPADDRRPDGRGLAIKLLEVPGKPILPEGEAGIAGGTLEQDFLLTNHPVFFAGNAAEYATVIRVLSPQPRWRSAFLKKVACLLGFIGNHPRNLWLFIASALGRVLDPFDMHYHSMSPYRFGDDMVVRYIVRPSRPGARGIGRSANFMRDLMVARLDREDELVVLDFLIQVRAEPTPDDVENASLFWNRPEDVEIPLARIKIRSQRFNRPGQLYESETMVFSPWNCTTHHRPIGGINRIRLSVYRASRDIRRHLNCVR